MSSPLRTSQLGPGAVVAMSTPTANSDSPRSAARRASQLSAQRRSSQKLSPALTAALTSTMAERAGVSGAAIASASRRRLSRSPAEPTASTSPRRRSSAQIAAALDGSSGKSFRASLRARTTSTPLKTPLSGSGDVATALPELTPPVLSPRARAALEEKRRRLRGEKSALLGRALLRGSVSFDSEQIVAARAEMAATLLATKTPRARAGRRVSATPVSRTGLNFSGTWVLNKTKSDDQGPVLSALGVGWVARKAIAASKRTIVITHEATAATWVEKVTTSIITKSTAIPLDGSRYDDTSPIDSSKVSVRERECMWWEEEEAGVEEEETRRRRASHSSFPSHPPPPFVSTSPALRHHTHTQVELVTTVEEGGRCIATRAHFLKAGHRQLVRRWVEKRGKVYHVCNEFIPNGTGDALTCHTYFDRI